MGGDWNFIENNIDKIGGNSLKGFIGEKEIKSLCTDFELIDIFRSLYPTKSCMTWVAANHANIAERLDRFYVSKSVVSHISSCDVYPFAFSDHDLVEIKITCPSDNSKGPGHWHFNTSL